MQTYRRPAPRPVVGGFRPRHLALLLAAVLLLATVGWIWQWLRDPQSFPVRALVVEGRLQHVQAARVLEQVKPLTAVGFLRLDPLAIRQAVSELPWVDQVAVWREWPDQLRIRVVEQKPVALWRQDEQTVLVNSRGELFRVPAAQMPKDLPVLEGPLGQQKKMLTQLMDLNRTLQSSGTRVTRLELDARGSWRCTLNGQIHLALGRTEPFARLQRWLAIYPQIRGYLASNAAVDLRYANGFAMMNPLESMAWERK
ncbi:MAG: cell division protein FtsQ/DivIB [Pseudomonadota bacterium]